MLEHFHVARPNASHGKNVYSTQTAEKSILWFKVRAKGTLGHMSMPPAADNSVLRMNKVVEKLGNCRSKTMLVPTVTHAFGTSASNRIVEDFLT